MRGKPLVYLDNAATSQKPQAVIDAVTRFYSAEKRQHPSRGPLPERAGHGGLRAVRARVARFLNAASPREIVFTRGTTEGDQPRRPELGPSRLQPGDEILITEMEHHSNIVPWQLRGRADGAVVRADPDHRCAASWSWRPSTGC